MKKKTSSLQEFITASQKQIWLNYIFFSQNLRFLNADAWRIITPRLPSPKGNQELSSLRRTPPLTIEDLHTQNGRERVRG